MQQSLLIVPESHDREAWFVVLGVISVVVVLRPDGTMDVAKNLRRGSN